MPCDLLESSAILHLHLTVFQILAQASVTSAMCSTCHSEETVMPSSMASLVRELWVPALLQLCGMLPGHRRLPGVSCKNLTWSLLALINGPTVPISILSPASFSLPSSLLLFSPLSPPEHWAFWVLSRATLKRKALRAEILKCCCNLTFSQITPRSGPTGSTGNLVSYYKTWLRLLGGENLRRVLSGWLLLRAVREALFKAPLLRGCVSPHIFLPLYAKFPSL